MKKLLRPLLIGSGVVFGLTAISLLSGLLLLRSVIADLPRLPEDPSELAVRPGADETSRSSTPVGFQRPAPGSCCGGAGGLSGARGGLTCGRQMPIML